MPSIYIEKGGSRAVHIQTMYVYSFDFHLFLNSKETFQILPISLYIKFIFKIIIIYIISNIKDSLN